MSVDGMDSIFSIALGLGLRLILGSASNHDPRVAGTLVGLWEGVVLYHFLDKFPGSVDPYVGLAVRLFVDLLATASFVRLAIVLLWTFLGLVIADITPAFWYDRSLRRFVRRTRRYLHSFEWPEMPSSLAEMPRWRWRLPWLSTLSTMPSRVRFFHIPPRTRSNPDPHIEPVSPSAVADITVPAPAPEPAPTPALRRRSIPTAPAPVTSTTSTTFTTSTTGSNNVIFAASSLPSALRRTNSSSKSSSSVSFDIERGRPTRALNPPMPSLAVHTATGAPSLPHNAQTQFSQMPVPTIPTLDDPAPPSLRPPTISPISIPMATMPTPQSSASASAPALGPIPLILPTTMPEPHVDVTVPSVDDLPEIPPLSARADREMAFPDLAPKSADEEPPPPFSKLDPLEPHARVRRPSNTNEKSALPGERFSVISDGTRDSIVGRADVLRQEARAEEQERDRLRLERQVASGERRYADALRLKVEAEEAHERSVNLHRRADARYFKAHNLIPEPFTVDLHRLGVPEARRQMEKAIRDALISGGRQVRVIVGRGLHSVNGMPVLKERMQDALQQHHFLFEDDPKNPGVIVVSLPVG